MLLQEYAFFSVKSSVMLRSGVDLKEKGKRKSLCEAAYFFFWLMALLQRCLDSVYANTKKNFILNHVALWPWRLTVLVSLFNKTKPPKLQTNLWTLAQNLWYPGLKSKHSTYTQNKNSKWAKQFLLWISSVLYASSNELFFCNKV